MSKNDFAPEAQEIHSKPLTIEELRQRLKHIAGLCWGLSIDLNNEIERNERQAAEIKKLQAQIVVLGGKLTNGVRLGARKAKTAEMLATLTPQEREEYERKLAYKREYAARKRKQKAIEAMRGQQ